jgi:hypothetical protein
MLALSGNLKVLLELIPFLNVQGSSMVIERFRRSPSKKSSGARPDEDTLTLPTSRLITPRQEKYIWLSPKEE